MFLIVVVSLAIISVLWAVWSLRGLKKDGKVTQNVKQDLAKGRVIFQGNYSSEVSSASSDTEGFKR